MAGVRAAAFSSSGTRIKYSTLELACLHVVESNGPMHKCHVVMSWQVCALLLALAGKDSKEGLTRDRIMSYAWPMQSSLCKSL